MEDMSPVSVSISLSNPVCANSGVSDHMNTGQLEFATEAAALLLDRALMLEDDSSNGRVDSVANATSTSSSSGGSKSGVAISTQQKEECQDGQGRQPSEKVRNKNGAKSVFELDCVPLWGSVSLCGHRPEMEDTITASPHFMKIPVDMFAGDSAAANVISPDLNQMSSHFFGVFDGHGGSEVANYCRDRIQTVLMEELNSCRNNTMNVGNGGTKQGQWEKVFTKCFARVDDEVGGESSSCCEPVAHETVGSTAVVAVVSSSHIIVANCGDSRAVLYRGKEAIPLSDDHKPNREDEYARIEARGGKVISWNGHRVFGVLAMSRSIGDRYMKPSVISEPEVVLVARGKEDECLVLASDGLWDVMTNEEACQVARRQLLRWHRKNSAAGRAARLDRGRAVDPAAQAAAECLCSLALQKGSKDNISVIVVDLKSKRRFKNRSLS